MVAIRSRPRAGGGHQRGVGPAGDHQPTAGDPQVERLVESFAAVLKQHILAGDAEIGGAVLHIGWYVAGADDDQLYAQVVGIQDQLAAGLGVFCCLKTGGLEQWQGLFEDASLGERDGEPLVVGHGFGHSRQQDGSGVGQQRVKAAVQCSSVHAPDDGAQRGQLLFDIVVAAIDMVDAVDQRVALGDQASEHQAGRGAQIGGHHRRRG